MLGALGTGLISSNADQVWRDVDIQYSNGCIRLNFQLKTVLLKDSKSNIDYVKMGFIIASIVLQVRDFENFKVLKIKVSPRLSI